MAAVDTETLQAEVNSLRAEVESLKVNLQHYMDISAHWGTENAALKKRVAELELVARLSKEVMDMDAVAMDRLAELAFSK